MVFFFLGSWQWGNAEVNYTERRVAGDKRTRFRDVYVLEVFFFFEPCIVESR